jgi:hypothetical protein
VTATVVRVVVPTVVSSRCQTAALLRLVPAWPAYRWTTGVQPVHHHRDDFRQLGLRQRVVVEAGHLGPEGVVEPVEHALMKQCQRALMAVLAGALGGSKRHKRFRAVQRLVEHAWLPL